MDWLKQSFYWYFYLLILGIIFIPLTKAIFKKFTLDHGYPFAKTLAIIFISYSIYLLSTLKILSFTRFSLFLILVFFVLINLFLFQKQKKTASDNHLLRSNIFFLIFEEILFIISFLLLVFIRGQEPSIRGLEKFMDFGFINSILRTKFFPPLDMWLSADYQNPYGYPINYYYFGHLSGAFLIKLSNLPSVIGYNLILATIFAQGITLVFSLVTNLILIFDKKINFLKLSFLGILGSYLVNLSGNLHTIYLFTKGYPNDNPIPFWKILSWFNPQNYWYANATRFIPYTIHEFPSYSYVVADLHGHVFDIPFVLTTLAAIFLIFLNFKVNSNLITKPKKIDLSSQLLKKNNKFLKLLSHYPLFIIHYSLLIINYSLNLPHFFLLGFLIAINYMTNAFDGPIYFLLSIVVIFWLFGFSFPAFFSLLIILFSFFFFSLPFSSHFQPFVSGIGLNCSPEFLTKIGKFGPFLFEKGNCQISPLWMLFILWGFFWLNFIFFLLLSLKKQTNNFLLGKPKKHTKKNSSVLPTISNLIFILFTFGTFLILIPEFFYIKDIYPAHFRANTMFKLGYQAFIMMSIASTMVFYLITRYEKTLFIFNYLLLSILAYPFFALKIFLYLIARFKKPLFTVIYLLFFIFIFIYPFVAFPSYYGNLNKTPQLDGSKWLEIYYPQDKEIIDYLNKNIKSQPVILEAQGDSYTDFERISAYTGLPTVAGWWVHEWLWRGSPEVVGKRIPDIVSLYESKNITETLNLIKKYKIQYIIVSQMEKQKYPNLNEEKFSYFGEKIFQSSNKLGALYKVKQNKY